MDVSKVPSSVHRERAVCPVCILVRDVPGDPCSVGMTGYLKAETGGYVAGDRDE
jgi:hypothetical protein